MTFKNAKTTDFDLGDRKIPKLPHCGKELCTKLVVHYGPKREKTFLPKMHFLAKTKSTTSTNYSFHY